MKRHLRPGCPSFERSGIQCHRFPTSLLASISSHCLATSPAKMSAFKGQCHHSPASLLAAICSHRLATLPAKMSAFKRRMRQSA